MIIYIYISELRKEQSKMVPSEKSHYYLALIGTQLEIFQMEDHRVLPGRKKRTVTSSKFIKLAHEALWPQNYSCQTESLWK